MSTNHDETVGTGFNRDANTQNIKFNYTIGKNIKTTLLDLDLYVTFKDQFNNFIRDSDALAGKPDGSGNTTDLLVPTIDIDDIPLSIGDYSLASGLKIVEIVIELEVGKDTSDNDIFTAVTHKVENLSVIRHELNLEDVSIPLDQWEDAR